MTRFFKHCIRRALVAALMTIGIAFIAAPAYAAGAVDRIKARGELVVGTEPAFEPFEFMQGDTIVGYDTDILHEIVKSLNVKLDQVNLPFSGILPGLAAGKFDLVATAVTITPERAQKYAYTRPVSDTTHVLLVKASNKSINSVDDLAGKKVAGQLASSFEKELKDLDARLEAEHKGKFAELKLYQAFREIQLAVASGQVDAMAISTPMAAVLMKKHPNTFRIAAPLGPKQYLAWVVRPEDKDLRDYINREIGVLKANGTLDKLQMKWFGFSVETPESGYLPAGAL